jgi:hypothetical protein
MPKGGLKVAIVALALALLAQASATLPALPWPPLASTTLAGLFLLVAITHVARSLGVRGQEHTPHAVAGVAATGAFRYAGAALVMARPELGVLAALHVVAAALAFGRPAEAAVGERAWLVAASTGAAVSLVAIGALPHEAGVPGAALVPSLLPVAMLFGAWFLGTGRMIGLLLTAGSGTVTIVLVARVLSRLAGAGDLAAGMPLRLAPMLLTTAALGGAPAVIAMALRLEPMWAVLAPGASAPQRKLLVWATLPVLALAAAAVLAF